MSGHSHAKTIKHQKELTDQKRGQIFSKMARMISIAVKQGGSSPETNYRLKVAMETARSFYMPKENIERAIKLAIGGNEEASLEEVIFEAYGPGGIAVIIEGITDNKNRTLGSIKKILGQYNGKLVSEGAIRWMFERKGVIVVDLKLQNEVLKNKEDLELKIIEAGAEDLAWKENEILEIYAKGENLENIKKNIETYGIKIESAGIEWAAKDEVNLEEKERGSAEKLFEALDEDNDIQNIYSNLKD